MIKKNVLFSILIYFALSQSLPALEPGNEVPKFEGTAFDGTVFKIEDFIGKPIIIDFWASWCGPCRKEFPFLMDVYNNYKEKGLVVLGINIDKKQKNAEKFIESFDKKPEFPIIFDSESKIPPLFDISTMPTTVFVDKKGLVKYVHPGFTEDDKNEIIGKVREMVE